MGLACALSADCDNLARATDAALETAPPSPFSNPTTRPARRRVPQATSAPIPANPLPSLQTRQDMLQKIREIYASDYIAPTFKARRALAQRLIEASEQTHKDSDAKYVFLAEARDLSAGVGDVPTAFDAIEHLSQAFPIVKLHERTALMTAAAPAFGSQQAQLAGTSICMDLADQCAVEGDFDSAGTMLSLASQLARQARSKPYATWVDARIASLKPLTSAYEIAKPAQVRLSAAPGDADANTVMGKFAAFIKGDFDAGLTMLAKGSDPTLVSLAAMDLETPRGQRFASAQDGVGVVGSGAKPTG